MPINKKIIVAAFATLALGASSCKKYLDVNNNPNVSSKVTVQTLLPAAELYIGSGMGVDMQINGSIWAQFWTQSPDGKEYIPFEQFVPRQESFNVGWSNLYAGAENFFQLQKLAAEQHKNQYLGIALVMQAYTFQVLTDAWGDVPYTEALMGQYPDGHIVNPKYDSQRVVYRGIIAYIDSAKKLLNGADAVHPGADDLVYGGDMNKWIRFANTLKLRVLMRMTGVDPVYAQGKLDTMFMGTSPLLIRAGDDAQIKYGFNTANNNPLYAELSSPKLGGKQELAGSATAINMMNTNNDSRGLVFYKAVNTLGLVGVTQSEYDIALPGGSFSTPSAYVGADVTNPESGKAPVILLSSWESYFLQAEAAARGVAGVGNDATLFYDGIRASFMFYSNALLAETGSDGVTSYNLYINGVPPTTPPGYWAVYPTAGTLAEKTRHIITQKWFAMAGNQGFEAWTEWRRTGYPDFLVNPRNSHIGTAFPQRFLYPASEVNANSNYPGMEPITTNVWWDVL